MNTITFDDGATEFVLSALTEDDGIKEKLRLAISTKGCIVEEDLE